MADGTYTFSQYSINEGEVQNYNIYDLRLFYDKEIDKIHELQEKILSNTLTMNSDEEVPGLSEQNSIYESQIAEIINNCDHSSTVHIKNIYLKEWAVNNAPIRNKYVADALFDFYYSNQLPDKDYFPVVGKEYAYSKKAKDILYGVVDASGVVLMIFGQDHWADAAGLLIATLNKDWDDAASYGSAVVLVAVPAILIKPIKNGAKFLVRKINGDFVVLVRGTDGYVAHIVKYIENSSVARKLIDNDIGFHLYDGSPLAKILETFESTQKKVNFVEDVANNKQLLYRFIDNPKLIQSWKVLDDAKVPTALRTDPVRLGQIDNYLKKNPGIEDAIKKGFNDVGDYKEEFLNGIKNATEDLATVNGRSALPDEIADAVTKIKQHRIDINKAKGKNFGYLEGDINGNAIDNKIWSSGEAKPDIEPQIFDAIEVEGSGGRSWLRNTDSEYKMLNKLADDLGGVKGKTYPDMTGTLKIVSENPYCASCQGVIQQFNEMFPNVKLILVDGVR
jgi:hypothetical protein